MKRFLLDRLMTWKESVKRKPILIRGARQVGKTWLVRELGQAFSSYVEVNFELFPAARKIFTRDLDPKRIARELSLLLGKRIIPGETLLFFDEIQDEPLAIRSLRYFYEMLPELHVVAAGSLLDFELEKTGLPVGRITPLYLYPVNFLEFLKSRHEELLIEAVLEQDVHQPMPDAAHRKLLYLLGEYLAIGGMPEAVACWCETDDLLACSAIHRAIVDTYRQDFNKYAQKFEVKYVELLFNFIPSSLGRKFKFTQVPGEYRKRELMPALELLVKAGVAHKVSHSSGAGIPLGAQARDDVFKVIFLDIALAQTILGAETKSWLLDPELSLVNKGGVTEALVGQEMLAYAPFDKKAHLYYWNRESRSSAAEVDYLIEEQGDVIPIEVKSGSPGTLKSLRIFLNEHPLAGDGLRFSGRNFALGDRLCSMPLYAVVKTSGAVERVRDSLSM